MNTHLVSESWAIVGLILLSVALLFGLGADLMHVGGLPLWIAPF